jgi:hypothetical protein
MPWSETSAMEQKSLFIPDWRSTRHTVADFCRLYDISRETGYKWNKRCLDEGPTVCSSARTPTDRSTTGHRPRWKPRSSNCASATRVRARLGISLGRIEPGRAQQNRRRERMHRTLKAGTPQRPAANHRTQQRRFNYFGSESNQHQPHEALDMRTPAQCHSPSPRSLPDTLPALQYPDRFEVRYVRADGGVRWKHK